MSIEEEGKNDLLLQSGRGIESDLLKGETDATTGSTDFNVIVKRSTVLDIKEGESGNSNHDSVL